MAVSTEWDELVEQAKADTPPQLRIELARRDLRRALLRLRDTFRESWRRERERRAAQQLHPGSQAEHDDG